MFSSITILFIPFNYLILIFSHSGYFWTRPADHLETKAIFCQTVFEREDILIRKHPECLRGSLCEMDWLRGYLCRSISWHYPCCAFKLLFLSLSQIFCLALRVLIVNLFFCIEIGITDFVFIWFDFFKFADLVQFEL